MKTPYTVTITLYGSSREIYVKAHTPSQAIALAKMQATPLELRAGTVRIEQ